MGYHAKGNRQEKTLMDFIKLYHFLGRDAHDKLSGEEVRIRDANAEKNAVAGYNWRVNDWNVMYEEGS